MRSEVAGADRRLAVRVAAGGWRRAGMIDDAALRAISSAFPDDRVRLGLGFRILAACAALFGGGALAGLIAMVIEPGGQGGGAVLVAVLAALFVLATEFQTGRLRRAQAGAEYATAILAAVCAGLVPIFSSDSWSAGPACLMLALALGLAAWRWGHSSLAAFAAVFFLAAAAQLSMGRSLWLFAGLAAFPMILRLARSPNLPPAHRESFLLVGVVFLAGAYAAANVYSLDHRWIESLGDEPSPARGAWVHLAAIAGTIAIPPLVLAVGVRFRERSLLAAGALFTAASLVTLRQYHPIGPSWLSLVLGGTACLAIAVGLRRWLHAGLARERSGFTAEPLFEDRRLLEAARAAAVVAAMSPAARAAAEDGFTGGGGRSGGGGATGNV